MKFTLAVTVSCLLLVSVAAAGVRKRGSKRSKVSPNYIVTGPENHALIIGPSHRFICQGSTDGGEAIQWWEYGTDPNGAQISDGNVLLPSHPNFLRYAIDDTNPGQFDLVISQVLLQDGAYYQCLDANAAQPDQISLGAQLVTILRDPNCTTTLPDDMMVIEGDYHTAECAMYFGASSGVEPLMTWTGPPPFSDGYVVGNASVWSGIGVTVTRDMNVRVFECLTNFTDKGFTAPDSATNIPTWSFIYRTPQLLVGWPPKNMYYEPVMEPYPIGTVVTCKVDAFPMPTIWWQDVSTAEIFYSQSFTVTEDLIGNRTMRCHAENRINGVLYYDNLFMQLVVDPLPTTQTPGLTTTTTAPPPEADCFELTGQWEATNPKADMCIWLDLDHNGVLSGMFKNDTDTFWADIYGKAQVNTYDQGGFSSILPSDWGIASYVFECRRCNGVETMTVSYIRRSDVSATECGDPGVTLTPPDFTFYRVTAEPPCTSEPP